MDILQNTDRVVQFTGHRKDMRFPAIAEVRAYWEALRNGRQAPLRSEIDPRGIERALEHAFITERVAPGVTRLRLAGMGLNDLVGMEVRGMPLTTFFTPASRNRVADAVEAVFSGPHIIEMAMMAETGFGKPPLQARLVLLPLQSDLGDINRALGCLVASGSIGRTPRRFDLTEVTTTAIIAGAPRVTRNIPASGFAEDQSGFTRQTEAAHGHLRLVKSDD